MKEELPRHKALWQKCIPYFPAAVVLYGLLVAETRFLLRLPYGEHLYARHFIFLCYFIGIAIMLYVTERAVRESDPEALEKTRLALQQKLALGLVLFNYSAWFFYAGLTHEKASFGMEGNIDFLEALYLTILTLVISFTYVGARMYILWVCERADAKLRYAQRKLKPFKKYITDVEPFSRPGIYGLLFVQFHVVTIALWGFDYGDIAGGISLIFTFPFLLIFSAIISLWCYELIQKANKEGARVHAYDLIAGFALGLLPILFSLSLVF